MLVVFGSLNYKFIQDKMVRLLLILIISAFIFSSCKYSDRQNSNSTNRIEQSKNYPIDDRNGFKDLLFGEHIDSIKSKIESNTELGNEDLKISRDSINLEKKQILRVSSSYLNKIDDVAINNIELYFFDSRFYEIRFSFSGNNGDLMYNTFITSFGFTPTPVTGWYRMHTEDIYSQPERIDLPVEKWQGNKITAIIIGDTFREKFFSDEELKWQRFRMWDNSISAEAQIFIDERPNRISTDF
jgi:hypothetical protein